MSQHETRPEAPAQLIYSEDRCAVRWPLVVHAVLSLIALAGCGIAMNLPHLSGLGILGALAGIWVIIMWISLIYGLYVGIRIDTDGIQIGGIRARERRIRQHRWPPRKPFHVSGQSRAVFTCPWEGARSLYLVTDREDFRHLRRDYKLFRKKWKGTRAPLGSLNGLFTKALLVITHNAIDATSDPAEFRATWGQYANIEPVQSPTWIVPTKNPEALRAALEQAPGAPRVQDKLPPEAIFQFRSG
jgi:hypothetical protein